MKGPAARRAVGPFSQRDDKRSGLSSARPLDKPHAIGKLSGLNSAALFTDAIAQFLGDMRQRLQARCQQSDCCLAGADDNCPAVETIS